MFKNGMATVQVAFVSISTSSDLRSYNAYFRASTIDHFNGGHSEMTTLEF